LVVAARACRAPLQVVVRNQLLHHQKRHRHEQVSAAVTVW
jgi:hypothetical protein